MQTFPPPLWTPSPARAAAANMTAFRQQAAALAGHDLADYAALHRWSVEAPEAFWLLLWDYCGVIGDKGAARIERPQDMPGAAFFTDSRLNYAQNLLRRDDDGDAIVFRGEDQVTARWSWRRLAAEVSRISQAFAAMGVKPGDRIAAMLPNMPEAIALMLAASALGAIWSSCSPDFGERGVLDRFSQIEPKIFIACDGYFYAGKRLPAQTKLQAVAAGLPSVAHVLIVDYVGEAQAVARALPRAESLAAVLAAYTPKPLRFTPLPFNHPLYILYSSGTTGVPKCIVHSAGGTLLQHLKEHRLHSDLKANDRLFYFTTCGWMMWNWLASGLASGAALILYDGSPFHPKPEALFDYAQAERVTHFGTSAKYIDACNKAGVNPAATHDLSTLRAVLSTGSPLAAESFDYVYTRIKQDVHLASISGGTDIMGCFVLGDPTGPVRRAEIQAPGLGMAVDVWSEDGQPLRQGKGELVCTRPFPSMPVMFWNDADGSKYRAAYFARFANVWCHGDFAEWTAGGGMIIHGRSDATLNPGGVRIGTAELYAQVERIPEVLEALAIGQDFDNDVRIILFVRLRDGVALDAAMVQRMKAAIRAGATPRHVPAKIIAVADIPRTKSGKITELAVRDIVHGRDVKNREALANPEALEQFRAMPELMS